MEMFKIIAFPTSIGYPLGIAIVELGGGAKVESDSAKLISDDSSSDATEIDSNINQGTKFGTL